MPIHLAMHTKSRKVTESYADAGEEVCWVVMALLADRVP